MTGRCHPSMLLCSFLVVAWSCPLTAGETLNYTYDTNGRLIKVGHTGTVNNNVNACYSYDKADNRSNVTVSLTSNCTSPSVNFTVNDVSVDEGNNLTFTVTKTGTAASSITLNYETLSGGADEGADYTPTSGTLTFLTSNTSKTVTVATVDDALIEGSEAVVLNIFNPSGSAGVIDGQGVGTILDNDTACSAVSFAIASNGAVEEGLNSVFTVTKSGTATNTCSVIFATSDGPTGTWANSPADYTAKSGTLTFAANETSKTISVVTTEDTAPENAETFSVTLSNPNRSGSLGSPSTAAAAISDDDTCIGLSFTIANSGAVTEGAGSLFTVTKTGTSGFSCSVNYATANGTASAASDYTAASGTLTFSSTQTSQTVIVPTIDDTTVESSETFSMSLSNPINGAVLGTPSSTTATVSDNDGGGVCSGISYSVNDPATVTEGSPLVFTVSKTGSTSSSCTIGYATSDGTGIAGTHYVAKSGTLTFTSGQAAQSVTITTIDNELPSGTKTMYLNLTTTSGGASISDSQGLGQMQHSGDICGVGCGTLAAPDGGAADAISDPPPTELDGSAADTSSDPPPPEPE